MGRIDQLNVVGVLEAGTEGPVAYLVMEVLRGESHGARGQALDRGYLSMPGQFALGART